MSNLRAYLDAIQESNKAYDDVAFAKNSYLAAKDAYDKAVDNYKKAMDFYEACANVVLDARKRYVEGSN